MAKNLLTDKKIKSIKTTDKQQKLFDGDGLYLYIPPTPKRGTAIFRWKYQFTNPDTGKQERYKGDLLNSYPTMGLKEAREVRELLKKQKNPNQFSNKNEKETNMPTFGAVGEQWFDEWSKAMAQTTLISENKRMNKHFRKRDFYNSPINEVTRLEITEYLKEYKPGNAVKIKSLYNKIFKYAIEELGIIKENPVPQITLSVHRVYQEKRHAAILGQDRLTDLIRAVNNYDRLVVRSAMQILMHTALRTRDMRLLQWCNVDFDNKVFHILKTKNKRHLTVPMSTTVYKIFQELKADAAEDYKPDGYVFSTLKSRTRALSDAAINTALRIMQFSKEEMCAHGFRTIFSTFAHGMWDIKGKKDIIEFSLDHKTQSDVAERYNHAEFLDERRVLMEDWSMWLLKMERGMVKNSITFKNMKKNTKIKLL